MTTIAIERNSKIAREIGIVLLANLFLILSGQIAFTLPFTCVPITFQVTAVLLMGALLGPKRAFFATLGLLCEAAAGLPVLSSGAAGLVMLVSPTAGYLFGYLFGAVLSGKIAQAKKGKMGAFLAMCAGNIVIYALGSLWLYYFLGDFKATLMAGVVPFILLDLCKNAMFAQLKLESILRRL